MSNPKRIFNNILTEKSNLIFGLIFIGVLVLRFIKAYLKTDLTGDEAFFMNMGMNLLNGRLAVDTHSDIFMWNKYVLHYPPLHSFLIAAVFKIADISYKAFKTVPFIIGAVTPIIAYLFAKRYIGPKEALLIGVFLCFDPIYFERSIDARPEMTVALFFTISALLYILALERKKVSLFALSGITAGVTFLTSYHGYWLILGAIVYMTFSRRLFKDIKPIFAYLGSFLITIFPFLMWLFWNMERRNIFFSFCQYYIIRT